MTESTNEPEDDWLADLPDSFAALPSQFQAPSSQFAEPKALSTPASVQTRPVKHKAGSTNRRTIMIAGAFVGGGLLIAMLAAFGWWVTRSPKDALVADTAEIAEAESIPNRVEGYPWESSADPPPTAISQVDGATVKPTSTASAPASRLATSPIADRVVVLKQMFGREPGGIFTGLLIGQSKNGWVIATTGRIALRPATMPRFDPKSQAFPYRQKITVKWIDGGEFPNQVRQSTTPTTQIESIFEDRSSVESMVLLRFAHVGARNDLKQMVDPEIASDALSPGEVEVIGYDAAAVSAAYPDAIVNSPRLHGTTGMVSPTSIAATINASKPESSDAVSADMMLTVALPPNYGGGAVIDSKNRLVGIVGGTTSDADDRRIIAIDTIVDRIAAKSPTPVVLPVRRFSNGGLYAVHFADGIGLHDYSRPSIVFETADGEKTVELARMTATPCLNGNIAYAAIRHLAGQMPKVYLQWKVENNLTRESESFAMRQTQVGVLPDWNDQTHVRAATKVDPQKTSSVLLEKAFNGFAIDPANGDVYSFRTDESVVYRFPRGAAQPSDRYEMPKLVHAIDWNHTDAHILNVELLSGELQQIDVKTGQVQPSTLNSFALSYSSDPGVGPPSQTFARSIDDPLGAFRIRGKEIQGLDGRRIASLSDDPISLIEGAPLLLTAKQAFGGNKMPRALQMISTNDWQPVGEAIDLQVAQPFSRNTYQLVSIRPLPENFAPLPGPRGDNRYRSMPQAVGVDQGHGEVVCCNEYWIERLSLEQFGVKAIPDLRLATSTKDLTIGRPSRIEVFDGKADVVIEFAKLPMGIDIDGRTLQWTPSSVEAGPHRIPVITRQGAASRQSVLTLNVGFESLPTPFPIDGFELIPSGNAPAQYAVGWSKSSTRFEKSLSLFSLTDKTKSKTADFDHPIQVVGIFNMNAIVVLAHEPNQARIIDLKSMKSTRTLLADQPIEAIEATGNLLRLKSQQSESLYDARTFRRLSNPTQAIGFSMLPCKVIEGGLVRDGVYRAIGSRMPDLILHRMGLPTPFGAQFQLDGDGGLPAPAMPFEKISTATSLELLATVEPKKSEQTLTSAIQFDDPPVVASLVVSSTLSMAKFDTPLIESRLFLTDADGLMRANVLLHSGLMPRAQAALLPSVKSDGRSLYIAQNGRLLVADPASILRDWSGFTPLDTNKFRFRPPRERIALPTGNLIKLEHQVENARGTVQYFLPAPPTGVTIDQDTGTVKIDGQLIRQTIVQNLAAPFKSDLSSAKPGASSGAKGLQTRLTEMKPALIQWEQRLQRPMDGFPALVPIHIRATDA